VPRGSDRHGGGAQKEVTSRFPRWLTGTPLERYVLHFERAIETAVARFSAELPVSARVLDAGAGEGQYAHHFTRHRYTGVDLGVGDTTWNYAGLHAMADLLALPFPANCFDACLNVVTLEHIAEPQGALREMQRVLKPGGRLLLVVPHEWEVHQAPHDYFRFTRHGVRFLLESAGFGEIAITPAGGYFRLMSRRLLNGLRFFHGVWFLLAAVFLVPPALVLPLFDSLDRDRDFTLGYLCTARKHL
jgi:SAM-dependent methyltransferase